MSKSLFIFLNAAYFIFNYLLIPYLPNPLLFGWLPFQLFSYFASLVIAAILWGTYFNRYLKTH